MVVNGSSVLRAFVAIFTTKNTNYSRRAPAIPGGYAMISVERDSASMALSAYWELLAARKSVLNAALAGLGLAYLPEDVVQPHVAAGALSGRSRTGPR